MIEFDPTTSLPKRIENYEIIELLGKGAMGYVFRARDPELQVDFALKLLKSEVASDASARDRFLREARAAAKLNHDHIVPVHRVRDIVIGDQHYPYLVMPLLQGETLQDRIARADVEPISLDEQRTIGEHIARGLSAAHEAGLVHRDIKPANIWLESRKDGVRAKILDFGLARSLTEAKTTTNVTMGSPAYMSPEQWKSSKVDHRADLWSLGVVLYEMATGQMPFQGETVFGLMTSVANDDLVPVRQLEPSIPKEYAQLIEKLLVKKCEQRLSTADEAIAQFRVRSAGSSTPLIETGSFIEVPKRRKRGLLIGLMMMVLILNIALVTWLMNRPAKEPTSIEMANNKSVPTIPETKIEKQVPKVEDKKEEPKKIDEPKKEEPKKIEVVEKKEPPKKIEPMVVVAPKVEPKVEPPKKPALLSGDLTNAEIDRLRKAWADYYGVKLEYSEDLGKGVMLEMVFIPPGTYWMGSPEAEENRLTSETQHEVTISEGFYIGKYEVTQEQYEALMGTNPSYFQVGKGGADKVKDLDTKRFPVETVNWNDTQEFMTKLIEKSENNKNKRLYRLPREGEWEYICRGGQFSKTSFPFHFEDGPQKSLSSTEANFDGNYPYGGAAKGPNLERTTKVGAYQKPNRFGFHDMHGNVYEWCEDWYDEKYYANTPKADPLGPEKGVGRVLRGGFWCNFGRGCRASFRSGGDPTDRDQYFGFRVLAPILARK